MESIQIYYWVGREKSRNNDVFPRSLDYGAVVIDWRLRCELEISIGHVLNLILEQRLGKRYHNIFLNYLSSLVLDRQCCFLLGR